MKQLFGAGLLAALIGALTCPAHAADPENLLRAAGAVLEVKALAGRTEGGEKLVDADPSTVAVFETKSAAPVELVYGFEGQIVSPEKVVLSFSEALGEVRPARVDLLVSMVSADSGYRSLRIETVEQDAAEQAFGFRSAGARWIMVRLFPQPQATSVALGELAVLGHSGPPETEYAFAEAPARVIDVLTGLRTDDAVSLGGGGAPADDKPFGAAQLADAALIASGVVDLTERTGYLARLDDLARQAIAAVPSDAPAGTRGEALLHWVHQRVLTGGYQSEQTDLSVLLDTGKFNCVSSAVLYNILALELGLDARAIEVPDHAFSIVYDGADHMDVETTTADGFNPARERIAEFEALTGFRYIPESDKSNRREIGAAGLAALIYYNHAVADLQAGHYREALVANFRAMSLDQEFVSAVKNALAALANWSTELARESEWERGVEIAGLGARLAPSDAGIAHNHEAIWTQWAISRIDAGDPEGAIATLERAAVALPDRGFEEMQAMVFLRPGEQLAEQGSFAAALQTTEPGLQSLPPAARAELNSWRAGVYLRWANAEIERGDFELADEVLVKGLRSYPDDWSLDRTLAFLAQEWTSAQDYDGGLAVLSRLRTQYDAHGALEDATTAFVWRSVKPLADAGDIEPALSLLRRANGLLADSEGLTVGEYIYDTNARPRLDRGEFEAAALMYAEGLKAFPDSSLLQHNRDFLMQEWVASAHRTNGPAGAEAVTERLAAIFPDLDQVQRVSESESLRRLNELVSAGSFAEADSYRREVEGYLGEEARVTTAEMVFDAWARERMVAGDWQGALEKYAAGLVLAPSSYQLGKNAAYLIQEWTRQSLDKSGIDGFREAATQARIVLPDLADVSEAVAGVLFGFVEGQVGSGRFQAAVGSIESASPVLSNEVAQKLYEFAFDTWAKQALDREDWHGALAIYDEGLARAPKSSLLKHNREYTQSKL